jgi:hypothetical protein
MELQRAVVSLRVPTVERQHVQVRVHRERVRAPLHEHHRAALHRAAEPLALTAEDRLHEHPRHRRQHALARREQAHPLGGRRECRGKNLNAQAVPRGAFAAACSRA